MEPQALTILEAGRRMSVGRSTVYGLIRSGRLKARKLGKRTLVLRSDVDALLAELPICPTRAGAQMSGSVKEGDR